MSNDKKKKGADNSKSVEENCPKCNDINEAMLQCERCENWFCAYTCVEPKLNDDEYKFMKKMNCHWYCQECEHQAIQAVKYDKEIEERCSAYLSKMTERVEKLEATLDMKADKAQVNENQATIESQNQKLVGLSSCMSTLNEKLEEYRKDILDREARRNKLIIRGRKEDGREDTENLIKKCEAIISALDKDKVLTNVKPNYAMRLGKKRTDGKPRPIKMMLNSPEEAQRILRNAAYLKDCDEESVSFVPKEIHICPDLSKFEREQDLQLRNELKEKRDSEPGFRWKIKNGKVMRMERIVPTDREIASDEDEVVAGAQATPVTTQ